MASNMSPEDFNADKSHGILVSAIVNIVISALFYAGRIWSRRMTKQSLDMADYTLLAGMICSWGYSALIIYGCSNGLGQHMAKLALTDPELKGPSNCLKGLVAVEVLYLISLACIKISFLLFYRRLFGGETYNILYSIIMAIIIIWAIAGSFVGIFTCNPVHAFWTFSLLPTAKCINTQHYYISTWVPNIVTDLMILCLPQLKVWKLQINTRSKIAVGMVFLLGSFVMITSIIRFTKLFQVDLADVTWTLSTLSIWTSVELLTAVASACMPLMRPIYLKAVSGVLKQFGIRSTKLGASTGFSEDDRTALSGTGKAPTHRRGRPDFERLSDVEGSEEFTMEPIPQTTTVIGNSIKMHDYNGSNGKGIAVTRDWSTSSWNEGNE